MFGIACLGDCRRLPKVGIVSINSTGTAVVTTSIRNLSLQQTWDRRTCRPRARALQYLARGSLPTLEMRNACTFTHMVRPSHRHTIFLNLVHLDTAQTMQ